MTKQMNVNELKTLMNLAGWTHTQTTEITKRADNGNLTGIVEITSKNQNVPFEIHYNEGFEYNSETGTVTVDKENVLKSSRRFPPFPFLQKPQCIWMLRSAHLASVFSATTWVLSGTSSKFQSLIIPATVTH
jgi:hypothetical protein